MIEDGADVFVLMSSGWLPGMVIETDYSLGNYGRPYKVRIDLSWQIMELWRSRARVRTPEQHARATLTT